MIRPAVSVIVPIYNVRNFLPNTLSSLKNQTLQNVEFICINDGSTDGSKEILEKEAKGDSRFRVINQKNSGIGATRNNGLGLANGEYIGFIDSDDTFEKTALDELYSQAKKQNTDMTVFNYRNVTPNGEPISTVSMAENMKEVFPLDKDRTFCWKDVKPKIFGGFFWTVWNKFFKNDFIKGNNIRFSDCCMSEDNAFVLNSTLRAGKIGYNDRFLYNYTQLRPNSAVNTVSDRGFCIFDKVFPDVKTVIDNLGYQRELQEEFDDYITDTVNFQFERIASKDKFKKMCEECLTPAQKKKILNILG